MSLTSQKISEYKNNILQKKGQFTSGPFSNLIFEIIEKHKIKNRRKFRLHNSTKKAGSEPGFFKFVI